MEQGAGIVSQKCLHHIADLIAAEATLDAGEMGQPVREGFGNAADAAGPLRFYAGSVDKVMGDVYVSDQPSIAAQRRVPRGVVAAVVPWNFPT